MEQRTAWEQVSDELRSEIVDLKAENGRLRAAISIRSDAAPFIADLQQRLEAAERERDEARKGYQG